MSSQGKGLVLGCYEVDEDKGTVKLSKIAEKFSGKADGLSNLISVSGLGKKKSGNVRVFYGLNADYPSIAVTKIGKVGVGYNEQEEIEEGRENIRNAVAAGVKTLTESGVKTIEVDPCGDAEAAAEAATMCVDYYEDLKSEENHKNKPKSISAFTAFADDPSSVNQSWQRGVILAEGQNLARKLMEAPANHMTPTHFANIAQEKLGSLPKVKVTVREKEWAEQMKMGAYLSVARGSDVPPKFVEVEYKGGKEGDAPFALVGKGITFDTGGISLKPPTAMDEMRSDMGGGACVLASLYTAARLQLPINLMGFIPLCENMPSGHATKPGDVVTSMSGKTIQIDNTDAEGRLILCDALHYAQTFNPSGIIDMATLTGAMKVSLGAVVTGVFTNSTEMYNLMHKAGTRTGDRVWRLPLMKHYGKQMKNNSVTADINNISGSREGGSCTAAAFLKEFVTHDKWMHIDTAGVMITKSDIPYLPKGMSGRPTRTVVEFLNLLSKSS